MKEKKEKIDTYVANKVKEMRLTKQLSQLALASELDVSVGFVAQCESPNYDTHYNVKHLNKLAKILKCNPQEFLPSKPL